MNDVLSLRGAIAVKLTGPNGEVKQEFTKDNLIVTVGKAFLASAIINASASPFTHMAIGTSGTAPAAGDTSLGAEIARQAFTSASVASNVVTLSTTYAAGVGTGSLQEAGIFNAGTSGTMLSHVSFSAVGKGASDSLTITWTITVG